MAAKKPSAAPSHEGISSIIAELRARRSALMALVAKDELGEVQARLPSLLEVVSTLPQAAESLPADARGSVVLGAIRVREGLDGLHAAADAGDAAAARAALDTVAKELDVLANNGHQGLASGRGGGRSPSRAATPGR